MESLTLEAARSMAFEKAGRNLFHYQKLELLLKQLAELAPARLSMNRIQEILRERNEKLSRMTLGAVVGEVGQMLFASERPSQEQLELFDVVVSYAVTFGPVQANRKLLEELRDTTSTRNELVHHMLAELDPRSIEQCVRLSEQLDSERDKFLIVWQKVSQMALDTKTLLEAHLSALEEASRP